ncbi:MAG: hypothetical protein SOW31_00100 [Treponema sp.]|nr:hypothetical protein [Treponema sp.]
MGVKLELIVSRTETIQPKQDEVIYSINWDNGKYDYDDSIYPVMVKIGKIIIFETENPVIIDFINWVDTVWAPLMNRRLGDVVITEEQYNEYDNKCIKFEKAVTAETGYNFKTEFNEFTDENTIECVRTEKGIYWEFGF